MAIKYSVDDKKFRIRPKKETKKELGYSPGHFDVAKMLIHKYKTTQGGLAGQLLRRQLDAPATLQANTMGRAQRERAQLIRQSRVSE